jgi:hypothetical protein
MTDDKRQIELLTELLRSSPEPMWARLRVLLVARGIDPHSSLLAGCFPDDANFEFGILVTNDGHVFQFGLDYLHKTISEGKFSEWQDMTERYRDTPYSDCAQAALALLESEAKR